jgi:uncharacterized coiled-coil protein SlyX
MMATTKTAADDRLAELERMVARQGQALAEVAVMFSSNYGGARERAVLRMKVPALASFLDDLQPAPLERRAGVTS